MPEITMNKQYTNLYAVQGSQINVLMYSAIGNKEFNKISWILIFPARNFIHPHSYLLWKKMVEHDPMLASLP